MVDYRDVLQQELERRSLGNPSYSLRAFARDLQMAPSRLSEVLNSRRGISEAAAKKLTTKLGLTPLDSEAFVNSVGAQHARSEARRKACAARSAAIAELQSSRRHSEASYAIYAWYYSAIMAMPHLSGFQNEASWIAKRLGILEVQVKQALRFLVRLGFLKEVRGRLQPGPHSELSGSAHSTKKARYLRVHYNQVLQKASQAVSTSQPYSPSFLVTSVAIDPSQVAEAEALIMDCRHRLAELAGRGKTRDRIYMFATQFFRIDQYRSERSE